jgi:hypothetical protein
MIETAWIELTSRERTLLLDALSSARAAGRLGKDEIDALTIKLVHAEPHPDITVGVHGGQVEWVKGNPFPIRVLDYDNDYGDAPDMDERGRACRRSIEPADNAVARAQ